jgi:5'-3' exonuclease
MLVHLVDGTYELFRCYYGLKRSTRPDDGFGAVRLVIHTLLEMVEQGATHLGVATDHVIESFRNELWPYYKNGEGVEPALMKQFHPLEDALAGFGFVVWPMVELEADDALASAAHAAAGSNEVEKVCIWTPDKDLAQCVVGERVVQVDRRSSRIRDAAGVEAKFGVPPYLIPDYLALVGDTADGYPGIGGWGAKSTAAVLNRHGHLTSFPVDDPQWTPSVAGGASLARRLRESWKDALVFLQLATLRTDAPLFDSVQMLEWKGPRADADRLADSIGASGLLQRARKAAGSK